MRIHRPAAPLAPVFAAAFALCCEARAQDPGSPAQNVLLICIDTLRPDHLGCYGYERDTSPNLDRLAGRGVRFERAYSTSSWTLPSVSSLFTGLAPERHRATHFMAPLSPQAQLLAMVLEDEGYHTAAAAGNYFLQPVFGLNKGFESYNGDCLVDRHDINSDCVSDYALKWLSEEARPGFFLYLHYFDPHYNYHEHEGFEFGGEDTARVRSGMEVWRLRDGLAKFDSADHARLAALYDSEIAFTDHHVGRVLDWLDASPFADDTIVIVTADHGESLGEHGWIGHTVQLYEETIRVPLIIAGPGIESGVCRDLVQLSDVTPTVFQLLGITPPGYGLEGQGRAASMNGGVTGDPSNDVALIAVSTQIIPPPRPRSSIQKRRSFVKDNWKLLIDKEDDGSETYRIFHTIAPKGLRKKIPEKVPDKVQMLLDAIEADYQRRLSHWDREDRRRQAMAADAFARIEWPFKYILDEKTGDRLLFNLETDPGERHNLAAQEAERLAGMHERLVAVLEDWRERRLAPPPVLSGDAAQDLREKIGAMGYTMGGKAAPTPGDEVDDGP